MRNKNEVIFLNSMTTGFVCTLAGFTFLMVTFTLSEPFLLWACLLGASIIVNVVATALFFKTMKTTK